MLTTWMVTRQRENYGPCQELITRDYGTAVRAYEIAVNDGDQFVELYNLDRELRVRYHVAAATHVRY